MKRRCCNGLENTDHYVFDSEVHVHAEKGVLSGRWCGPAAESDVTGAVSGAGSAWPHCPCVQGEVHKRTELGEFVHVLYYYNINMIFLFCCFFNH